MIPTVCTCSKLRRAARAVTRLYNEALAPWGLTTTQFAILRTLQRIGPTSVAGLARATGHERSAMTRSLARWYAPAMLRSAPAPMRARGRSRSPTRVCG